jgi:molybdopterin adenylyltransferase
MKDTPRTTGRTAKREFVAAALRAFFDGRAAEHREHARAADTATPSIGFAIITTTDSRSAAQDESGALAARLVEASGLVVAARCLLPNHRDRIAAEVGAQLVAAGVDVVLVLGGTGLSARDVSVDAVAPQFTRVLPGFGELFRALSFAEVGAAAMLSRATGGVANGKALFVLPGSPAAVRLALEKLILPEIAHLLAQARAR